MDIKGTTTVFKVIKVDNERKKTYLESVNDGEFEAKANLVWTYDKEISLISDKVGDIYEQILYRED